MIITLTVCTVLSILTYFIILPCISFASSQLPWFIFLVSSIFSIGFAMHYAKSDKHIRVSQISAIVTVAVLLYLCFISLIGSPVLNSVPYRDMVSIEEKEFTQDFQPVVEDVDLLDLDSAQRLGDRALGEVPNAPWYEVSDEYNLILYHGKQYRLSPLEYRSILTYFRGASTGIPGYVLVSVDTQEAQFIQTAPIKVSPSGLFRQNLGRHLRWQFPSKVFDRSFMEIDEQGNPFWVTATLVPQAGLWGAYEADGLVLTDACTGESQWYKLDERPDWIDHVLSLSYLMDRVGWHYSYVHGWWNGSRTDVYRTTYSYHSGPNKETGEPAFYGYNTFVDNQGRVLVYTGLTPANRTESNVAFLTVDTATGEVYRYSVAGAEESSAQSVVEGLVQNMGYQATFPIICNIGGEPVYLMNLKDKSGLIQRYALVSYKNYSKAYVGNTFEETLQGYLKVIGQTLIPSADTAIETVTGTIEEKFQAEIDGNTVFYYVVEGKLYRSAITVSEQQVLLKVGDSVTISFTDGEIRLVTEITKE